MTVALIWAQGSNGVIGVDGTVPWDVPEDFARFKRLTLGNPVIMGRSTWDSLPDRFRPLPDRRNIVVTRDTTWSADGADVAHTIDDALALAETGPFAADASLTWIIGGAQIYAETIARADLLEVTEIATAPTAAAGQAIAHAPAIDPSHWTLTPAPADSATADTATAAPTTADQATAAPTTADPATADPAGTAWQTSRTGLEYRYLTYTRL